MTIRVTLALRDERNWKVRQRGIAAISSGIIGFSDIELEELVAKIAL